MNPKKLGGALLLTAGAFLARETLVWAFNKLLDAASSGLSLSFHFVTLSWQNGAAVALVFCGAVLILWPRKKMPPVTQNDVPSLWPSADDIVGRVRSHRSTRWFARDRLEPTSDIARDGIALLVTFEKAGFPVPHFNNQYAEQVAVGLEAYFSSLTPLMRQGHILEAKALAASAAENAVAVANKLKPESEWFYPDY